MMCDSGLVTLEVVAYRTLCNTLLLLLVRFKRSPRTLRNLSRDCCLLGCAVALGRSITGCVAPPLASLLGRLDISI
jgi:hypothetical protein